MLLRRWTTFAGRCMATPARGLALAARPAAARGARRAGPAVLRPAAAARRGAVGWLGGSFGLAAGAFTGSILLWPIADLVLGPLVSLRGLRAGQPTTRHAHAAPGARARLADAAASTLEAKDPGVAVCHGPVGFGQELERQALNAGREVAYFTLREATSTHDFWSAAVCGVYAVNKIGAWGILVHSMGTWWTMLFDMVVGKEHRHSRMFNFSVAMQHLRRALRLSVGTSRPLVIVDHFSDSARYAGEKEDESQAVRAMLNHLVGWCATVCFDTGLADVVICSERPSTSMPAGAFWRPAVDVTRAESATELRAAVGRWLP